MGIERVANTKAMAPAEPSRSQKGNLYGRMKIHTLHEWRCVELAVTPCHSGDAAIETEVDGNPAACDRVRRQLKIHCRKLPHHDALTGEETRRSVVEDVEAGTRSIPGEESLRLFDRGGD